jgi:hypothetical protein
MNTIPLLTAVPALGGFVPMTIEWPVIGAFIAWTLIAALVGIGLGALRRMTSKPPTVVRAPAMQPRRFEAHAHVVADRNHLQAA